MRRPEDRRCMAVASEFWEVLKAFWVTRELMLVLIIEDMWISLEKSGQVSGIGAVNFGRRSNREWKPPLFLLSEIGAESLDPNSFAARKELSGQAKEQGMELKQD